MPTETTPLVSESEIAEAYQSATAYARRVAHGDLDADECLSAAGEAVSLALKDFNPDLGASFTTRACGKVRTIVLNEIRTNAKYANMPAAFWDAIEAGREFTVEETGEIAGTKKEIAERFGISATSAHRLKRAFKNAA